MPDTQARIESRIKVEEGGASCNWDDQSQVVN